MLYKFTSKESAFVIYNMNVDVMQCAHMHTPKITKQNKTETEKEERQTSKLFSSTREMVIGRPMRCEMCTWNRKHQQVSGFNFESKTRTECRMYNKQSMALINEISFVFGNVECMQRMLESWTFASFTIYLSIAFIFVLCT